LALFDRYNDTDQNEVTLLSPENMY